VSDSGARLIAVIPARSGSKRVPRKNIRLLGGRPLIAWAIETCLTSALFDSVIVSTDDPEIAALAEENGASVPFERPAVLSDDDTPLAPVIAHAISMIEELGLHPDAVCCVYPGSPGLTPDDLRSSWATLEAAPHPPFVVGVSEYPHPIQRALTRDSSGMLRMVDPGQALTRTQDLPPLWHDAGQFVWGRTTAWRDGLPILDNAMGYELSAWRAIDLDTEDDWMRAEIVFRVMQDLDART